MNGRRLVITIRAAKSEGCKARGSDAPPYAHARLQATPRHTAARHSQEQMDDLEAFSCYARVHTLGLVRAGLCENAGPAGTPPQRPPSGLPDLGAGEVRPPDISP